MFSSLAGKLWFRTFCGMLALEDVERCEVPRNGKHIQLRIHAFRFSSVQVHMSWQGAGNLSVLAAGIHLDIKPHQKGRPD